MKGEIDEKGNLLIKGAGVLRPQFCPYRNLPCGDHCPKFGEPYESEMLVKKEGEWETISGQILNICTRDQLFFTELIDNRK